MWGLAGAVVAVSAGLTVAAVRARNDASSRVSTAVGSTITALIEEQLPEAPGGFFDVRGIERPSTEDLSDLEIPTIADASLNDPTVAEIVDASTPEVTGLEDLVGIPIVSVLTGDARSYVIPSGLALKAESALCAAGGRIAHIYTQISGEGADSLEPPQKVSCIRNRVSILDPTQGRSAPSISTADWQLMWTTISARNPERFIVQDVKSRRTRTLAQGAADVLGPFADDDALAQLARELGDRGWTELTPPSLIGFVSGSSKGVQILALYPSNADADAARASFEKALPTGDPEEAKPAAGGGVSVSRIGRILELNCPNAVLTALFALPGRFPTFYVPG